MAQVYRKTDQEPISELSQSSYKLEPFKSTYTQKCDLCDKLGYTYV